MGIVIGIFNIVLILIAIILVLLVLMQKTKSDGGAGAAFGGGMTESAFGGETNNVLNGLTIKFAIAFFILCFGLFLANIWQHGTRQASAPKLPSLLTPAAPATPTEPGTALPTSSTLTPAVEVPASTPAAAPALAVEAPAPEVPVASAPAATPPPVPATAEPAAQP
jgi:preprotein translocase subunit SecG